MGVPISALSPLHAQNWPFPLSALPQSAYLVGGIVRDAFLDRQGDYLDLDFVVPENAIEVARQIARRQKAGFVVLDAERQIARIVFPQATVDFALQEGDSLEADLRRRDFTVNAMAYNPHTHALIDPLGGYHDLQARCLRMIAAENLAADPLRLLRAYRQAAQLHFHLEPETKSTITAHSALIRTVAAERVQSELSYLFHHPQGIPQLVGAWQAGLVSPWFPQVTPLHLARLQILDPLIQRLAQRWPQLLPALEPPLKTKDSLTVKPEGFGRSLGGFLRLCTLLDDQAERAEETLRSLKASRWEIRSAALLWRLLPQLQQSSLSIREQYFLYKETQDLWPILAVLTLLHSVPPEPGSETAEARTGLPVIRLEQLLDYLQHSPIAQSLDQFFDAENPIAHPRSLITGKEVMKILNLGSGPKIGEILTEVQIAQAQGQIKTSAEALAFVRNMGILPGSEERSP
ncbi:MAG: CCA tRNA nucleotidyltransferase [Prochlorotrichaceae cyanobacterium]